MLESSTEKVERNNRFLHAILSDDWNIFYSCIYIILPLMIVKTGRVLRSSNIAEKTRLLAYGFVSCC